MYTMSRRDKTIIATVVGTIAFLIIAIPIGVIYGAMHPEMPADSAYSLFTKHFHADLKSAGFSYRSGVREAWVGDESACAVFSTDEDKKDFLLETLERYIADTEWTEEAISTLHAAGGSHGEIPADMEKDIQNGALLFVVGKTIKKETQQAVDGTGDLPITQPGEMTLDPENAAILHSSYKKSDQHTTNIAIATYLNGVLRFYYLKC